MVAYLLDILTMRLIYRCPELGTDTAIPFSRQELLTFVTGIRLNLSMRSCPGDAEILTSQAVPDSSSRLQAVVYRFSARCNESSSCQYAGSLFLQWLRLSPRELCRSQTPHISSTCARMFAQVPSMSGTSVLSRCLWRSSGHIYKLDTLLNDPVFAPCSAVLVQVNREREQLRCDVSH